MQKDQSDILEDTLKDLQKDAPVELVSKLTETLKKTQLTHPHLASKVTACLPRLVDGPTKLIDVLAIVYIMNGGVLLKYTFDDHESENESENDVTYKKVDDDFDLSELIKELDE
jgi:hypothetical protein